MRYVGGCHINRAGRNHDHATLIDSLAESDVDRPDEYRRVAFVWMRVWRNPRPWGEMDAQEIDARLLLRTEDPCGSQARNVRRARPRQAFRGDWGWGIALEIGRAHV